MIRRLGRHLRRLPRQSADRHRPRLHGGSFAYPVLESPHVPTGRIIALDPQAFVGSLSAAVVDSTESATVHMADPAAPIVDSSGAFAAPTTSLWQTTNIGMRATLDAGWAVVPGRVQFVDATP
jgi:hypothetical protein